MKKILKVVLILLTFFTFVRCSNNSEEILYNKIKNEHSVSKEAKDKDMIMSDIISYLNKYPDAVHREEIIKIKEEIQEEILIEKINEIEKYKNEFFEKKITKEDLELEIDKYKKENGEDEKINKIIKEIFEHEKKEKEEYETKLKKITSKIYSKYDEFDKIKWIYSKDNKNNKVNHNEKILIYGGSRTDDSIFPEWYRMKFRYSGSDFLFFDKVVILVDDKRFNYSFDHFEVERDVYYGGVSEYVDISFNDYDFALAVENCKEIKIRFSGKYSKDLKLSKSEIEKLKNILTLYNFKKLND